MYTLAIDMATRGIERDENGFASPGDLYQCDLNVNGELSKLLANRSLAHLKLKDFCASLEDAEASIQALPTYEKGHLRVLAAMEAMNEVAAEPSSKTTVSDHGLRFFSNVEKLNVVKRGLDACPDANYLSMKLGRLECLVKADQNTLLTSSNAPIVVEEKTNNDTSTNAPITDKTNHSSSSSSSSSILDATMKAANNNKDPRYVIACADLGASYACGAYGLRKDVELAEKYLLVGAEGGDVTARRNLGLLLLELKK